MKLKLNKKSVSNQKLRKPIVKKKEKKPFFSSGTYGCAYYPEYTCHGKKSMKVTGDNITKLSIYDVLAENEIETGKKIQKINDKGLIGVHRYCEISRGKLNKMQKQHRCGIIDKYDDRDYDNSFVLMYSKYIRSVPIRDLFDINTNLLLLITYMEFIYDKLSILQKHGLCHHDLHFKNVIVSLKDNEKNERDLVRLISERDILIKRFHIIDYGITIDSNMFYSSAFGNELNIPYLKDLFIEFDPTWKYWPIDYNILCYCLFRDKPITERKISDIIKFNIEHNNIFSSLPKRFGDEYLEKSILYYKKYANKNPHTVIKELLKFWNTWDSYQVSITMMSTMFRYNEDNYDLICLCLLGIHYNPESRPSVKEMSKYLQNIINKRDVLGDFNEIFMDKEQADFASVSARNINII